MLLLWLDRRQAHPYLGSLWPSSLQQVNRRKGDEGHGSWRWPLMEKYPASSDSLKLSLFPWTPAKEASIPGLVQGLEEQAPFYCFTHWRACAHTHTHTHKSNFRERKAGAPGQSDGCNAQGQTSTAHTGRPLGLLPQSYSTALTVL